MRAVTSITPRKARKAGFRNFPTESRILEGRRAKNSTAAKNSTVKITWGRTGFSPTRGRTPMVKLVAAHRGMAKRGPMVR